MVWTAFATPSLWGCEMRPFAAVGGSLSPSRRRRNLPSPRSFSALFGPAPSPTQRPLLHHRSRESRPLPRPSTGPTPGWPASHWNRGSAAFSCRCLSESAGLEPIRKPRRRRGVLPVTRFSDRLLAAPPVVCLPTVARFFSLISRRPPDTGKCPRHKPTRPAVGPAG
jgi:hypothetical protein